MTTPDAEPTSKLDAHEMERWRDWCRVAELGEVVPISPTELLKIIAQVKALEAEREVIVAANKHLEEVYLNLSEHRIALEAENERLREKVAEYVDQAAWRQQNSLRRLP